MKNIYQKINSGLTTLIAEAGVNHNGSLKIGKRLIDAAKRAGADCIKFQTYKAEKLTTKTAKRFWSWEGERKKNGTQYDSYSSLDKFNLKHYKYLFDHCKKKKIEFQSTPFDIDSLKILEKLGVSTYKIASCDITNFLLLEKIAKTKKPIFLSTGAANINEIKDAVKLISKYNKKIVIMHCILCYPTKMVDANLKSITLLKKKFPGVPIGFSDHTLGTLAPTIAASLGASVIEKHFTIDKTLKKSADHWLSVNEKELSQISTNIKNVSLSLGKEIKKTFNCENITKKNARRSLVANENIQKGQKFDTKNLTAKRPGTGISANQYFKYLGTKAKKNFNYDDLIK
jgi:N,N'-diacetyllegionaminate synthase|tara:strand:+ start:1692 stop:2720 length:1029 start_codon:yes stop_codon:yes gene_type:complete